MSKLLKRLNDNQNKVADTNGIMKLQAWDDGIAQDLTNKKIIATVANASGFLFDLDLVSNGTEIDLDFKDSQLQKLTPDTYFLEIKVTDEAGYISVFPTEGYATFTINKNLHATEGALVPQITFDTVLADIKTAMDKKVADYVKTIAKGDTGPQGPQGIQGPIGPQGPKGDTGPQGHKGDMDLSKIAVGGRNYILNSNVSTTSSINNFKSSKTISSFSGKKIVISVQIDYDNLTSISNIIGIEFTVVNADTNATMHLGVLRYPEAGESFHGRISKMFDFTSLNIKGYSPDNLTWGQGIFVLGVVGTNVSSSNPKIEIGNVATDWTPAPEDVPSNDAQLVHNTGNEVLAGDKVLTGNTTLTSTTILAGNYGLRVTPSGFQKTTDGQTWVSANI